MTLKEIVTIYNIAVIFLTPVLYSLLNSRHDKKKADTYPHGKTEKNGNHVNVGNFPAKQLPAYIFFYRIKTM
jgi:hypothetical protein